MRVVIRRVFFIALGPLNGTWHFGRLADLKRNFTDGQLHAIRTNGKQSLDCSQSEKASNRGIDLWLCRDTGRVKTEETHRKLSDHITAMRYCDGRSGIDCLSDSAPDLNTTLQLRTTSR